MAIGIGERRVIAGGAQVRKTGRLEAAALQRAQLRLLRDPIHAHPAYWSPFLLLNNWL